MLLITCGRGCFICKSIGFVGWHEYVGRFPNRRHCDQNPMKMWAASAFYTMWQSKHEKHWISNIAFFSLSSRAKLFFSVHVSLLNRNQTATNQWNFFFIVSLVVFVKPLYDETFSPAIYIRNGFAYRNRNHWSMKRTRRRKTTSVLRLYFAIMSFNFIRSFVRVFFSILMLFVVIRFVSIIFPFKHSCHNGHGHRQLFRLVVSTFTCINQKITSTCAIS